MSCPRPTVGQLAISVLEQQTITFLDHASGARAGRDPRAVHQMRVAARRMRAALRLFADVLPHTQASQINVELQWVAALLGRARDLDVQLQRLHTLADHLSLSSSLAPYADWLTIQRHDAQRTLESALVSARFIDLVQALEAISRWSLDQAAATPLADDAPRRLRHVFRAFNKPASRLKPSSPATKFHRVRIRAKRLRYATEFIEPYSGQPAQTFIKRLTRLQDVLGELQDSVVADEHIQHALATTDGTWPAQTLVGLGQLLREDAHRRAELKLLFKQRYANVAGKAWDRLASNVVMS